MKKSIRELIKKNGVISANETTDKKLNYLQFLTSGIVFFVDKDGEEFFVMPNEIQEIIKENDTIDLRRKIKENTTFYKIFKGILNAYGVLNENNLKRILKKYYNDVDEEELINRIMNEDNCVCECDIFYDNEERISKFFHDRCNNEELFEILITILLDIIKYFLSANL